MILPPIQLGRKMKRFLLITFITSSLLLTSACSGVNIPAQAATATNTPSPPPTPQIGLNSGKQTPTPTPPGTGAVSPAIDQCNLLDSRDLASLFSSAEVVLPQPKTSQVNHPIFAKQNAPASEATCVYYAYHQPGEKTMEMLQVTYWIDIPNQATPTAWAKVWSDASSQGAQAVSDVGDAAFFANGRLTFKKGNTYVTIEAIGTYLNTGTSTGEKQQIQIEKRLALDALGRLKQAPLG